MVINASFFNDYEFFVSMKGFKFTLSIRKKQVATPTAITDLKSIYGDVTITSFGVIVHQGTCVTITHRTLTQDMLLLI